MRMATLHGKSQRQRFDLVVNIMTAKGVREGCVTIHGGRQWRPMLHVRDAAEAYSRVLLADSRLIAGQIFNVGRDVENHTIENIGKLVAEQIPGCKMRRLEIFDRRNYRVSFAKIRKFLGFEGKLSVSDAAKELFESFKNGEYADFESPSRYRNARQNLTHAPRYKKAEFLYSSALFETFVGRITGTHPEPQSGKAMASKIKQIAENMGRSVSILDVGASFGHNFRSIRRILDAAGIQFSYTGIDSNTEIVDKMNDIFTSAGISRFNALSVEDYSRLPFEADTFDFVISSNFIQAQYSIEPILLEMYRICNKAILMRTLVGDMTVRIQYPEAEIDSEGNISKVTQITIYSTAYMERCIRRTMAGASCTIEADNFYDEDAIKADPTTNVRVCVTGKGRLQYQNYTLLPHAFVEVRLK